jgi:transglutaminase-like putative cysteine protease
MTVTSPPAGAPDGPREAEPVPGADAAEDAPAAETAHAPREPVRQPENHPPPSAPPAAPGPGRSKIERTSTARRVVTLALTAAITATAGYGFHRVFAIRDLAPILGVATVAPTVLSALACRRRRPWPLWTSLALSVIGWLATAILLTFHGHPDLHGIGNGLRDSWKGILTTILPAPGSPALLILPQTIIWFAAFAAAETAQRTRTRAAPAIPALAVFAVALLLGVDGPSSNLPVAAALTGLIIVLMLVRDGGRIIWVIGWVPVGAALVAAGLLVAPYLPKSSTPYDPRSAVQAPPPQTRDSVSPLDRVSAWLQNPAQQMFTVRSTTPQDTRLAVLDHFDGDTWTDAATFVPAGSRIPGAVPGNTVRVDQNITIQNLPGVWLPAVDRPRSVTGMGVIVDPRSGVITASQPLHPGQSYQVTSQTRVYTTDELADAVPASDAEAKAALALPVTSTPAGRLPAPEWFRQTAQKIIAGQTSPFQDAAKLAQYLSTHAKYNVTALSGHSYQQLEFFLHTSKSGTSEQFATAYALLARAIGLPTRVVVGFRPGSNNSGTYQVDSGDVVVWPEVDFAGLGWVRFNPNPEQASKSSRSNSVPAGETQQKIESAEKNAASQNKGQGKGKTPQLPPVHHPKPSPPKHSTPWWVYALIAVGCVPVLYVLAALIVPMLRRGRRRRADAPAERISGAWQHTLEQLRDVGLRRSTPLTAHEVAGFAISKLSNDSERPLRAMADLVNRSEYAASSPTPAAADQAWEHAGTVQKLVTRTAGRPRRLLRRLHPRSLRL